MFKILTQVLKIYNIRFPREVCNPRRYPAVNRQQFMDFINANIERTDLFTNVYNFIEFNPPLMYPRYDTAIIDRLYFDCDQRIQEGKDWIVLGAYENMLKLHEWCMKRDIIHFPRMTGSSYDVIIAVKTQKEIQNKKKCIANAQSWLCKALDIKIDPHVIGDISRIHRIDHTYNHKPTARRFCIPLDEEIIYTGEKKIFEIARKQRFTDNRYGNNKWDITEFDTAKEQKIYQPIFSKVIIAEDNFSDLSDNIPICVKNLLTIRNLGYGGRRNVILCLRDNCYMLDETLHILKKYLDPVKALHCIREEKQPQYLYSKQNYLFPNQKNLMDMDACTYEKGKYCDKAIYGCLLYKNRRNKIC